MGHAKNKVLHPTTAMPDQLLQAAFFGVSALVLLALLGSMLFVSGPDDRSDATLATIHSAKRHVRKVHSTESGAPDTYSKFFGFLEFDWDPNAPGGVPGFDPWPRSSSNSFDPTRPEDDYFAIDDKAVLLMVEPRLPECAGSGLGNGALWEPGSMLGESKRFSCLLTIKAR